MKVRVPSRTIRLHAAHVVEARGLKAEWCDHGAFDIRLIRHPRRRLDGGTEQIVAVARVAVARAGCCDERVVLEQRDDIVDVVEVPRVELGRPLERPMTNACEMRREQTRCDRAAGLLGKRWHIALDRRVEIDPP